MFLTVHTLYGAQLSSECKLLYQMPSSPYCSTYLSDLLCKEKIYSDHSWVLRPWLVVCLGFTCTSE